MGDVKMASDTTNVTIRGDKALKAQADELFKEIGLSTSAAINIFLRQAVREHGLPFKPTAATSDSDTPAECIPEDTEKDKLFEKITGEKRSEHSADIIICD